MRVLTRWRLAGVLGAAVATGCGARAGIRAAVERDSAGVVIVETSAPILGPGYDIRIDSVPTVDIGGGTDPRYEFGPDSRIIRLAEGSIVVGDRRGLRWFDPRGAWVRSVGREGSGPAEVRQIDLLGHFGDSVLVYDGGQRRISVFDSGGAYGRATATLSHDSAGEAFPLAVLSDGRLLLGTYPEPARVNGVRRDSLALSIGAPDGRITAHIGRFPWVDQLIEVQRDGVSMGRVPFARLAAWATFDSLTLVATNEQFRLDWYDARGRLRRSIRRPWTAVMVTEADLRAQVDEWLESFPAGMEGRKAKAREMWMAAPRLRAKPPYDRVVVSDSGDVWVEEYGEPGRKRRPSIYSVFDRIGRWQTQVSVPAGVEPVAIGVRGMVATWHDQDDATHVRVYQLSRSRR